MALTPGTRLGVYAVTAHIGAGGMGEVYRATDTNLKRSVAIKVLPASVAGDADRLARFQREAEVLAALNHPNIGAIYGLERSADFTALVMELVEGEDLSQRIARGAIPLDEALPIAKQIADALEAAHEQGIIHRDLKPANIKVRPDGTVKVLDLGLAKAIGPATDPSWSLSMSPTITTPAMTMQGVILGTAAYMAPEQAKGRMADKRADIWAFGVVLHEMLTGRRLFDAEDVSETLAAVLTRDVSMTTLPIQVPARLHALLRDCLVRDPKQRLRDIGDARRVLDQISSGAPDPMAPAARAETGAHPARWRALPWAVAALGFVGAATLALVHFRETPPTPQSVRFQVSPPEKSSIAGCFALSPDGRYVAFATTGTISGVQGTSRLWIRPIDSLEARALPGTEGLEFRQGQLFWSPDSAFIGFFAERKLKKVAVHGEPPQTLAANVLPSLTGSWGTSRAILFSGAFGATLQRVPEAGGIPLSVFKTGGELLVQPQFLPDGRHFLYYVQGNSAETNGIYVASLDDTAQSKRLLPDTTVAKYAPSPAPGRAGHLLLVRERTLMAQPFDPATLSLTGAMVPVAESVGPFSVSLNGTLAHMPGGLVAGTQDLVWIDRNGKESPAGGARADYRDMRLSPDEKSITFTQTTDGNRDVWVLDLARGVPTRITFDPSVDNLPIWSNDGRRLLWPSRRRGSFDLYIKASTGAGTDERFVTMGTITGWATDWSRDGRFVLYQKPADKTGQDLWIAPQASQSSGEQPKPFPYLESPFDEANGMFSPDGRWIAYESNESGRTEVYVQAFPITSEKVRISTGGGTDVQWNARGGELFYLAANRDLMAVPYHVTGTRFEAGAAKALFSIRGNFIRRSYAAAGDGRRFLVPQPTEQTAGEPITVVLNWQAGLRK